jgi:membrane protease YdiL (CAAX protease family)
MARAAREMLPGYALFATFAFTIVFGWLFNNTKGSVLMTLIAHAADGLVLTGAFGLNAIDSVVCGCADRRSALRADTTRRSSAPAR